MKPEILAELEETASRAASYAENADDFASGAAWELVAAFAAEARRDLVRQATPPAGRRQITLTTEEVDLVCYALRELANRQREQAIDRREPILAKESDKLRALADRIAYTP